MNKFPKENTEKEFYGRRIDEKHPSELTKSDLEFLLSRLQVSVAFALLETDPLEKLVASIWAFFISGALLEWADWQNIQTMDAGLEVIKSRMDD